VSARSLLALGTASQVPTRHRNHNGYFVQWDGFGFLFDPGEGTQRQMTHYGLSVSGIHHVCITHFHGDHCLGLPGVLQRASLDNLSHPLQVHYPASGEAFFGRLRHASIYVERAQIQASPIKGPGILVETPEWRLRTEPLDHTAPSWGYRIEEKAGWWLDPEKLVAAGLRGPLVGQLQREGVVKHEGKTYHIHELGVERKGQSCAVVMDTRRCPGALALAEGVDLLLIESTYLESEGVEAAERGHLTAAEAARIGRDAGVRQLVLSHFSQRHPDTAEYLAEAGAIFPEVVALEDGGRVDLPARIQSRPGRLNPTGDPNRPR
jgi:ribonuclease Z